MKSRIVSCLLAGFVMAGASALDLQLRNGVCLPDIRFVSPALNGVTLISTDAAGVRKRVTVPFSAISLPSLFSLRQYLRRNAALPGWDSLYLHPPAYSAALSALDLYLRRFAVPNVVMGNNAVFIRLDAPGSWQDECRPCPAGQVIWNQ
ncbi:MAG: hypothetical protein IJS14_14455 [Lentisphaeria bacterium]|nr:hypothetical protein [Lentisphaeria bacterium]